MAEALKQMEIAAANEDKLALSLHDVMFHSTLVESSKNEILEKMWKLVGAAQWTSVTISVHDKMDYFPVSHQKILDLAKARDVDGIVAELKNHFQNASDAVVTAIKKNKYKINNIIKSNKILNELINQKEKKIIFLN